MSGSERISVRLPADLMARIESYRKAMSQRLGGPLARRQLTRTVAIESLLEAGLGRTRPRSKSRKG